VFLDLVIAKLEHLQTICVSRLGCLCLSKVIHNLLIWIRLFDIMIVEEHDCIPIWECFSPYAVAKDYFLFTTQICSLNLSIVANYLILDSGISWVRSTMISGRHLHFVVFRFSLGILLFLLLLAALF
jgi:hypothetical protein